MTRFAVAILAVVAFAGVTACGNNDDGPDAQPVGAARPTVIPSTVSPAPSPYKGVGDKVWVINQDGSPLLDLTVDRFQDTTCDQPTQPTNGRFVTANLTVHTYDDPQNRLPGIALDKDWRYVGDDRKTVLPANTPAAYACHHEDGTLAAKKSYSAAVILDVPDDASGDLVSFDVADTHWEWELDN